MNLPRPVENAIEAAALIHGVSPYALLVKTNLPRIVAARREVFRSLNAQGFSANWIAKWFGMTHSNVLHHLKPERAPSEKRTENADIPEAVIRDGPFCARCGYRGKPVEFEPEGLHFLCRNRTKCADRFEDFLALKELVAKGFRRRYELLAASSTR